MTEFPSLADIVRQHRLIDYYQIVSGQVLFTPKCNCDWVSPEEHCTRTDHPEHVEQMWEEACIIRTVDHLDALPVCSVVKEMPTVPGIENMGFVWERWNGFTPQWMQMGYPKLESRPSSAIRLPARLLWHPEWSRS